jgi:hypothetical protein
MTVILVERHDVHHFRVTMVVSSGSLVSMSISGVPVVSVMAFAWDFEQRPVKPCRIADGSSVEWAIEQALIWRDAWGLALQWDVMHPGEGALASWIAAGQ